MNTWTRTVKSKKLNFVQFGSNVYLKKYSILDISFRCIQGNEQRQRSV
jgi:hypothetical protein